MQQRFPRWIVYWPDVPQRPTSTVFALKLVVCLARLNHFDRVWSEINLPADRDPRLV